MSRGRLFVIVNRKASRAAAAETAFSALIAQGYDLDIRQSDAAAGLDGIIAEEAGAAEAIVIAGGDGTVNSALNALIAARKPVAILPCGTANDLALTLGIPADPVAAADLIAAGTRHQVDVGRVNDACFINVASIGLAVDIARRQDESRKKQWGVFSYFLAALGTLSEAEPFAAEIVCGGRRAEVRAYQIAVGNGVHYGGGLKIAADARIDDGLLDIYAIETDSAAELATLAPLLRDGSLAAHDKVTFFRGDTARIETAEPMPINTDGEVTTRTPAEFSVLRGALEFIVPAA